MKMKESSGSVYRDLGYDNPEEWEAKAQLEAEIIKIIHSRKWTQQKAADFLGSKQSEISRLKRGQFDQFTLDRLVLYLRQLESDVQIVIRPRQDHQ